MEEIGDICAAHRPSLRQGQEDPHHVAESGSDFIADISGYPPSYFAERWRKMPARISNAKTGQLTRRHLALRRNSCRTGAGHRQR